VSRDADLTRVRIIAADVAAAAFDGVHGEKREDFARTTIAIFRERLARVVRVDVAGIEGAR
jgi:hypothetical protein